MTDEIRDLYWNSIGYAATAGAALVALVILFALKPSGRWFSLPRLRPGIWRGFDVVLVFCVYEGFQILTIQALYWLGFYHSVLGPAPDKDAPSAALNLYMQRAFIVSGPLILVLTLGMIFGMLFLLRGVRPHGYGLSWARWLPNVRLGMVVFLGLTPLVLGMHALASFLFVPIPHLFTQLGKHGLEAWEWGLLGFHAIVAAPLLEEIVFRGILQGWLRRASLTGHAAIGCVMLVVTIAKAFGSERDRGVLDYAGPILFAIAVTVTYAFSLYRLARRFDLYEDELRFWHPRPEPLPSLVSGFLSEESARKLREETREKNEDERRRWADANANLALLGAALLFAGLHAGAWPAPIALLLFGLAQGWLARRTQSLIGPIVVHALFNLVAFIALYGSVTSAGDANGNTETSAVRPSVVGSITTSVPGSQPPRFK